MNIFVKIYYIVRMLIRWTIEGFTPGHGTGNEPD